MSGMPLGRVKVSRVMTRAASPMRSNSLPAHEFSSWFEVNISRNASRGVFAASFFRYSFSSVTPRLPRAMSFIRWCSSQE